MPRILCACNAELEAPGTPPSGCNPEADIKRWKERGREREGGVEEQNIFQLR